MRLLFFNYNPVYNWIVFEIICLKLYKIYKNRGVKLGKKCVKVMIVEKN